MLNKWTERVVGILARKWAKDTKAGYLINDAYELASQLGSSFLDIGCGYGRFYEYLLTRDRPFHYIGYDSSKAMIAKAHTLHPATRHNFFLHNAFDPFMHEADVVLCKDVFVHLTLQDQVRVLDVMSVSSNNILVISIQVTEGATRIREVPLGGQKFLDVVQNEDEFQQTIFDRIERISSLSVDKKHAIGDVHNAVFVVRRNLAL